MNTTAPANLEEVIRLCGEGWLLDSFAPPGAAIKHHRETLAQIRDLAVARLGAEAPGISEETLVTEYQRNPLRVQALLQALGGTRTPEMLLMVWRLIEGMEIKEIEVAFHRQESFSARVVLQSPCGGDDETYSTSNIHDFALFRHIGAFEVAGRPVFDGFYALKAQG